MKKRPFAILGAGNAATALAILLARHGRPIHLYCIEDDVLQDINSNSCNTKYLAGVKLPSTIRAFASIEETVAHAEIVLIAVPSFAILEALQLALPYLAKDVVLGSITKGLHPKTLQPLAVEAASLLPKTLRKRMCVIGGPAVANELAHHQPAAFFIAGQEKTATEKLARVLHSDSLKVATSTDLIGVGYCMALKNVYAIALGMCDGLHYPMNTKALVTSLAVDEMELILKKIGGKPETAVTLAGLGDLLVTGFSPHGRNRTYGEKLVGSDFKQPEKLGLGTVEGIAATSAAVQLVKKYKIDAPFLMTVAKCLKQEKHFEKPFVEFLRKLKLH